MLRSALGWKPDVVREVGTLPRSGGMRAGTRPRSHDALLRHVDGYSAGALPILDQLRTQRCTSFALAETLWAYLAESGQTPGLANIHDVYVLTQRMEQRRAGRRAPLTDDGRYPRDMVDACAEFGVRFCSGPFDPILAPARTLEDVWLDEVVEAASYKVTGFRRIPDLSAPRGDLMPEVEEMTSWIAQGHPCMMGLNLDAAAHSWRKGVWRRDPKAPSTGLHMVSVVGYSDERSALATLWHWSEDHGEGGITWVSYETATYFGADRYALAWAPVRKETA